MEKREATIVQLETEISEKQKEISKLVNATFERITADGKTNHAAVQDESWKRAEADLDEYLSKLIADGNEKIARVQTRRKSECEKVLQEHRDRLKDMLTG